MEESFYKEMGRRIAALRREAGWSQEVLASKTEVVSSYIARIEIGTRHPSLEVLGQIASALEVPMWRLITDTRLTSDERVWKRNAKELSQLVAELPAQDVKLLTQVARRMHTAAQF